MKNKASLIKICLFGIFVFAILVALIIPIGIQKSMAEEFVMSENIIESDLSIGETINIPKGSFGNVSANVSIYCPNGNVYYDVDKLTIESHGVYELRYTAKVNGKTLIHSEFFTVEHSLYTLTGGGEASYNFDIKTMKEGLMVSLPKKSDFKLNKALDVSSATTKEPLVEFTVSPQTPGVFDATTLIFEFADASDTDCGFSIKVTLDGTSSWSKIYAAASGQSYKGYDNTKGNAFSSYGAAFNFSNSDNYSSATESYSDCWKNQKIGIYYDKLENKVYFEYYHFKIKQTVLSPLSDFDDTSIQAIPWDGFKTDKVFMTLKIDDYNVDDSRLFFTHILDTDLKEKNVVEDNTINIDVDFGEYDENNLVNGVSGMSYPVFRAVSNDTYGDFGKTCQARVFYAYSRTNGTYKDVADDYNYEVNVKDGRFETKFSGIYSICYRKADKFGDITERVVNVKVDSINKPITVLNIGNHIDSSQLGNIIDLAKILKIEGGVGIVNTDIKVTCGDEVIPIYGNDIDGIYIVPEKVGKYSVKYIAYDLVGNKKIVSYDITVNEPTNASFNTLINLPKYFIEDCSTVIPEVYMFDYRTNEKKLASVKIIDGNGEKDYKQGDKVQIKGDADGKAIIVYFLGNNERRFVVPVVNVKDSSGNLKFEKYFALDNVIAYTNTQGVILTPNGKGSALFINSLSDRDISINFKLSDFGEKFGSFKFTLTDSNDSSIKVSCRLIFSNDKVYIENNKNIIKSDLNAGDISGNLQYNNGKFTILNKNIDIIKDDNGKDFKGFPSGKVYIGFEFDNINILGEAFALISQIKDQKFNTGTLKDYIKPKLYKLTDFGLFAKSKGDVIEIRGKDIIVDDVLSQYTEVTVTVTFNGKTIKSDNGVELNSAVLTDYNFTLNEKGVYEITYVASDWNNRTQYIIERLYVLDDVAPEINVENMPTEASIGKIKLPIINITDNLNDEVIFYVFVYGKNSFMANATSGSFEVREAGEYEIVITAFDKDGNRSCKTYFLTVS